MALVLLPVAVMIGPETRRATACTDCALATEDTPFVAFVLSFPFYAGGAAVGAALGTVLARRRASGAP